MMFEFNFCPATGRAPRRLFAAALVLGAVSVWSLTAPNAAMAQAPGEATTPAPSANVVATVNGSPITEADVAFTAIDLADTLEQYSPEQRTRILMDLLINQKLMAAAAEKAGIAETKEFEQRMVLMRERTLRDFYFNEQVQKKISDADVRAAYDKLAAEMSAQDEVRARHILVKTREEAEAVIKELKGGADFAKLAGEKSIGPSKDNGGDLGFLGRGDAAGPFVEAALALGINEISEPVKTDFGWHVIKVEEKRKKTAPAFEQVESEIRQHELRQHFLALIDVLKKDAKIEVINADKPAPGEDGKSAPAAKDAPAGTQEKK